jgi:hypothetical protein
MISNYKIALAQRKVLDDFNLNQLGISCIKHASVT